VPSGWCLLDIPLAPARLRGLERALAGVSSLRRYCGGGNLGYVACPEAGLSKVEGRLGDAGLGALLVFGPPGRPLIGVHDHAFAARARAALDPLGRFPER
jgi:hypothetical protein